MEWLKKFSGLAFAPPPTDRASTIAPYYRSKQASKQTTKKKMLYSASETARRAAAANRHTCTTLATSADFDAQYPTASPEMKESFMMLKNCSSGLCPCGKRYGKAYFWCPMHACCEDCSQDPANMAKNRRVHICKVAGCDRQLNSVSWRCELVESQHEQMVEVGVRLQHALMMNERNRNAAAAGPTRKPSGKPKITEMNDPDEKAEAQEAARADRIRLAKKRRIDETCAELEQIGEEAEAVKLAKQAADEAEATQRQVNEEVARAEAAKLAKAKRQAARKKEQKRRKKQQAGAGLD